MTHRGNKNELLALLNQDSNIGLQPGKWYFRTYANSENPDQTARTARSGLGFHCSQEQYLNTEITVNGKTPNKNELMCGLVRVFVICTCPLFLKLFKVP